MVSADKAIVQASGAPKPNGNYSHCVREGITLHVCGFMGDHPESGEIVSGGIQAQTTQAILNIKAVLTAAGSGLDSVVRRRIYIINMADFREVDRIWGEHFKAPYPVSVRHLVVCYSVATP